VNTEGYLFGFNGQEKSPEIAEGLIDKANKFSSQTQFELFINESTNKVEKTGVLPEFIITDKKIDNMKNKFLIALGLIGIIILTYFQSIYYFTAKFGKVYNLQRLKKEVPLIEDSWESTQNGDNFIFWSNSLEKRKGHIGKEIKIEKGKIVFERDRYYYDDFSIEIWYNSDYEITKIEKFIMSNTTIISKSSLSKIQFDSITLGEGLKPDPAR
jgi:hypothetical protein